MKSSVWTDPIHLPAYASLGLRAFCVNVEDHVGIQERNLRVLCHAPNLLGQNQPITTYLVAFLEGIKRTSYGRLFVLKLTGLTGLSDVKSPQAQTANLFMTPLQRLWITWDEVQHIHRVVQKLINNCVYLSGRQIDSISLFFFQALASVPSCRVCVHDRRHGNRIRIVDFHLKHTVSWEAEVFRLQKFYLSTAIYLHTVRCLNESHLKGYVVLVPCSWCNFFGSGKKHERPTHA